MRHIYKGVHTDGFDRFCEERYPRLVGLLSLYCGDRDLAEDLAQEALARAFRDWSKVRTLDNPEGWVSRVAMNLANSLFRRRGAEKRARSKVERGPGQDLKEPGPDSLALREALARLPKKQRAVLVLRFYEDLSVVDTADLLNLPTGTVKTLTRKGLTTLRLEPEIRSFEGASDVL